MPTFYEPVTIKVTGDPGYPGLIILDASGQTTNTIEYRDGNGNLLYGQDATGVPASPTPTTVQTLTGNDTLTPTSAVLRTTNAGAVTGAILTPGKDGKFALVINEGTGSVTFAAAGTSNVADGVGSVIAVNTAARFIYNGNTALWYRHA